MAEATITVTHKHDHGARPIEWAILGVLLWILADVAAGSPAHAVSADTAHALFSALGAVCYVWAFLKALAE